MSIDERSSSIKDEDLHLLDVVEVSPTWNEDIDERQAKHIEDKGSIHDLLNEDVGRRHRKENQRPVSMKLLMLIMMAALAIIMFAFDIALFVIVKPLIWLVQSLIIVLVFIINFFSNL